VHTVLDTSQTRVRAGQKSQPSLTWTPPIIDERDLQWLVGRSVLSDFVQSHDFADVLRELAQNEYDAGGSRLEVTFGETALRISGNGKIIDQKGWMRLSVMMGMGAVAGMDNRVVEQKTNGIGSKNQGLRSLFLYGNRIYVRSGGKQTVLDLMGGALPKPVCDPTSAHKRGVQIEVPYRTHATGDLQPFTIEREQQALEQFATDLAPTLIKLALPGTNCGLTDVVVLSERCGRRISMQQVVNMPTRRMGGKVLHRVVRINDVLAGPKPSRKRRQIEEYEFQRAVLLPDFISTSSLPRYFVLPGGRIRLALSFRVRNNAIDISPIGSFFTH
jgi:hypothetical protein